MLRNPGLRKSVEQPVLDLNFAASQIGSNGAPDARMNDFNRGSNAWFVDSDGLVKKSPHNLHTYSEQFDNAYWIKGGGSVTANAITAPDGTLTADLFTEDTANSGHNLGVNLGFNYVSGTTYASSVYVKANGTTKIQLNWRSNWFPPGVNVDFDLTAETATLGSAAVFGKIENVGNGWYRCTAMATADATGSSASDLYINLQNDSGNTVYTGDGSSGVYLWGAQLSQHYVLPVGNPYVKTEASAVYAARLDHDASWFMSAAQEQNLLEYSEMLDDSYWTKVRSSVTANAIAAPDGTTTAELMKEDSSSSTTHLIRQTTDVQITDGTTYAYSGYVKAKERTKLRIRFTDAAIREADIDLSAGTITDVTAGGLAKFTSVALTDEGDGWFRFVGIRTANETGVVSISIHLLDDAGNITYTGDGSSGLYVWGLQLEVGSTAGTYHRTTGQPYYGEGATPKGLLIEEQRANLVTESEDFGTTWSTTTVTVDTDEVLAPDGATSADFLEETTATSVHEIAMSSLVTDATSRHVLSCFVKAQDRTIFRIAGASFSAWATGGTWPSAFFDLSTETVTLSSGHSAGIEDYGNGWYRCHVVGTSGSSPSAAGITVAVIKSGTTTSYTGEAGKGLYVWGAQLEKGDFLTSYMQTTGTSLTRNADVATMGPTVAPLKTTGPEFVTNGTFPTNVDGWTGNSSNLSYQDGVLRITADSAGVGANIAQQLVSGLVIGKRYRATMRAVAISQSGRTVRFRIRDTSDSTTISEDTTTTAGTTLTADFTATATSHHIRVRWDGNSSTTTSDFIEADDISLKEIQAGTELVTNGTFDTDSDWTLSSGWSITGGEAVASSAAQYRGISSTTLSLVAGRRYRASMDVASYTAGSVDMRYREGGSIIANTGDKSATGTFTLDFTCTDAASPDINIQTRSSGSNTFDIDNVSVRELYPFEQFEQSQGTIVAEMTQNTLAGGSTYYPSSLVFQEGTGTDGIYFNNVIGGASDTLRYIYIASDGVAQVNGIGQTVASGTPFVHALSYAANDVDNFIDGSVPSGGQSDNSATLPHPDRISFNYSSKGAYYIKRMTYFNRKVSDDTLQFLSDV